MFATIKLLPAKKGFISFICSLFHDAPPSITGRSILGIPYLEIGLTQGRRGIPWHQLSKVCDRRLKLILPKDIMNVPSFLTSKISDSRRYFARLTVNCAKEEIRRLSKERRVSILIYDPDGSCAGIAVETLRLATYVTVVTDYKKYYSSCMEYTMREIGAQVALKTVDDELPACDFLLAPRGFDGFPPYIGAKAVFSPENRRGSLHPSKENIGLPLSFLNECPDYISPFELAAALYNDNAVEALREIVPPIITVREQ